MPFAAVVEVVPSELDPELELVLVALREPPLPHPLTARDNDATKKMATRAGQRRRRSPGTPMRRREASAIPEATRAIMKPPRAPGFSVIFEARRLPADVQALSEVLMVTEPLVTAPLLPTLGLT